MPLYALVAAVVLVGGTAFAFRLAGTPAVERPRAEPARLVVEEAPAAPEPRDDARPAATVPVPAVTDDPSLANAPAPVATFVLEEPAPSAAPSAVASTAPAPKPPSSAEVSAALRATPIVMFSTSWCGVCRRARAFLGSNGLAYTERDVERDPAAGAELQRLTGRTAVPAFLVDGMLVGPGFSEGSMQRALVASVERRLGVKAEARPR